MINDHIDQAVAQVELHENYVGVYEDILEWAEESKMKIIYSEEETEFNQNTRSGEDFDTEYIAYCKDELKRHMHELERAKVSFRACQRNR